MYLTLLPPIPVNINALPCELIENILQRLNRKDVLAFRQSNKSLEALSFEHFGHRFFHKKGYMITQSALRRLSEIAAHPSLSRHVLHIWFNSDCYTFDQLVPVEEITRDGITQAKIPKAYEWYLPVPRDCPERIHPRQYRAWQRSVQSHFDLLYKDGLRRQLVMIFRSLSNLQVIGIRRSVNHDAYGWRELHDKVGKDPRLIGAALKVTKERTPSQNTQLFLNLIHSLAESDVHLQRLYTDAIEVDGLDTQTLSDEVLRKACRSIICLETNIIKPRHWNDPHNLSDNMSSPGETIYGGGLTRFFSAMPQLEDLSLQIFRDVKQHYNLPPLQNGIHSWNLSYPYITLGHLSTQGVLGRLTRCKLEKLTTDATTLCRLILCFASSLQSLKLRKIRLVGSANEKGPWADVFAVLADRCESLTYLLLHALLHASGSVTFVQDVSLPVSRWQDNMQQALTWGDRPWLPHEYVTVIANGRQAVQLQVEKLRTDHWYHAPFEPCAVSDSAWYTDTSDEE